MNLQLAASVIICKDFDTMNNFYQKVLQQEVEMDFGNCIAYKSKISLWELTQEYPIAKKQGYTYSEKGNTNFEFSFETEDYEELIQHLEQFDITYLHRTEEEVWGQKTIRLYDPENNLIEIGESIACFVKRLYDSGMSLTEVSEKTATPLDLVTSICSK